MFSDLKTSGPWGQNHSKYEHGGSLAKNTKQGIDQWLTPELKLTIFNVGKVNTENSFLPDVWQAVAVRKHHVDTDTTDTKSSVNLDMKLEVVKCLEHKNKLDEN